MAKPKVGDEKLYQIATYFKDPKTRMRLEAEVPPKAQEKFEKEYAAKTENHPLPPSSSTPPYCVLQPGVDKHGRELRIYFDPIAGEEPPQLVKDLCTDKGKWSSDYRINHSNLVMQLCECGFVLGPNDKKENGDRIEKFMAKRFPGLPKQA